LGDCLLHTPFMRHFRISGNYSRITCMVPRRALELFDCNPHIDELIGCDDRGLAIWAAPEVGCDLFSPFVHATVEGSSAAEIRFRPQFGWKRERPEDSIVSKIARHHGLQLSDESPEVFTAPEDDSWAKSFVQELPDRPVIVLGRRSTARYKQYPAPAWQAVVDDLAAEATLLDFSTEEEAMRGTVPLSPSLPLRRTAALFRMVHCVATVDSFFGHLAAAVGAVAVVVFGPSSPAVYGHTGNRNIRVSACPPCFQPEEAGCFQPNCLIGISPSIIVGAVRAVLNRNACGLPLTEFAR